MKLGPNRSISSIFPLVSWPIKNTDRPADAYRSYMVTMFAMGSKVGTVLPHGNPSPLVPWCSCPFAYQPIGRWVVWGDRTVLFDHTGRKCMVFGGNMVYGFDGIVSRKIEFDGCYLIVFSLVLWVDILFFCSNWFWNFMRGICYLKMNLWLFGCWVFFFILDFFWLK